MTGRQGRVAAIRAIDRYEPHRPSARIDLSDNTNLWGPPPSAREALGSLDDDQLSRYPTPYADSLVATLAELHGVVADRVVTGCGSDDILDSAIRACCDAGSTIAVPTPTFSVVATFAAVNEVRVADVELRADGSIDATAMLATGAALHYVCSPNNPTGTGAGEGELRRLLAGTASVVLVDEAYADFAGRDSLGLAEEFENLVVVRTLSKAHGLASLRIGYAIGAPETMRAISVSRGPYKVGALAEAVAVGVLRRDSGWVRERTAEVRELRDAFAARLAAAGFDVMASSANFVAVLVDDAQRIFEAMLDRGVLVRAYRGLPVFGDLVRITIGPQPLLDEAAAALEAVPR